MTRMYVVYGVATVSVIASVEARSKAEALRKAEMLESHEWACDDVDGDVGRIEVGEAEDKTC